MPQATLALSLPDSAPLAGVLTTDRDVAARVLGTSAAADPTAALVEFHGADASAAATALADRERTVRAEMLREATETTLVQYRGPLPWLTPFVSAGVVLEPPIVVSVPGQLEPTVRTSNEALSALRTALEESVISFSVEAVHAEPDDTDPLTDRQARVLRAALDAGYYEEPAGVSVTGLADRLDLAKSTVSETLRRAEAALAETYVDAAQQLK